MLGVGCDATALTCEPTLATAAGLMSRWATMVSPPSWFIGWGAGQRWPRDLDSEPNPPGSVPAAPIRAKMPHGGICGLSTGHWPCWASHGVGARPDTWAMSALWDEQLAGFGPASPLPATYGQREVAPTVQRARPGHSPSSLPVDDEWARWWAYARTCARRLAAGIDAPAIDVHGPVLEADEDALLSAELSFSRLYGGDGRYQKSDLFVVGRPAVMAGGLALSAAINHRRKVAARREAQLRWRDHQSVQVIATTLRLLCNTDTGWISAWYGTVTEFYPDLQSWSLTLGFDPGIAPLRLSGPPAPVMCLWAATCLLGDRWINDSRLTALLH